MPPIDPERLLRTLAPLLDPTTGAIKSTNEVDKLYGLMSKFSKKLVSKCVYISILKVTPVDIMDLFMQRGGWDMLFTWATDAVATNNWAILREICQLLLLAPATVARLKDNELPKIIKNLSRECECEETKSAARDVYNKWMVIAQQKEAPVFGADGHVISLNDANLVQYELPPNAILEADQASGSFDLTQYIDTDNLDLNNLETEFNPDDFNSTVEQHLMDGGEGADTDYLLHEPATSVIQLPSGLPEAQETLQQYVTPVNLQSTDPKQAPLCLVIRDGKRFLLRLQVGNQQTISVPQLNLAGVDGNTIIVPGQKVKSQGKPKMPSGKPKMPSPGKPKMSSSGKPPLKAYEAKAKKGSKEESSKGIPNFYGSKEKDKLSKDRTDKDRVKGKSKDKEGKREDPDNKKSKSRGISATEAAWKAEQEKEDKLRQRISEQKRVRDQRKEEAAKKQKEKDDETLKALKITALPPTKIPKIPKKSPSFADMIGIPGANSKEKDSAKKSVPSKTKEKEKEGKEKDKDANQKEKEKDKDTKTEDAATQRRSRPKVFMSSKSRSLGLLEDMEQTLDKTKNKEKEKEKQKKDELDLDPLSSPGNQKKAKRSSTENIENPTGSKKPKIVEKKEVKKSGGLQESSLFMDAIKSATTTRTTRSKRRSSNSDVKEPLLTPPPQDEIKPVVFNFYRDTLDGGDDKADDVDEQSPSTQDEEDIDIKLDSFEPGEGEGLLKSALVIHRSKNKPKKSVRWVDDEDLKKYHYFEMDDTERVNVSRRISPEEVKNFTELKQIERSEEGKLLKRKSTEDNMDEKTRWRPPSKILFKHTPLETGTYSLEAGIQDEREKSILEIVYFTKNQIPDSPMEPEDPINKIPDDSSQCKLIPSEDVPGLTKVHTYKLKPVVPESSPGAQETAKPSLTSAEYLNSLNMVQPPTSQQQQQMPSLDPAQLQYNLWNTLSQTPNPATIAATASYAAPGADLWSQMQLAVQAQQAAAVAASFAGIPNFTGLNMPYGYPNPGTAPGYATTGAPASGVPPSNANQTSSDQAGLTQNRFTGPPNRGGGASIRSRGGRPNRWDDRGNYDERRRDDFRKDVSWNNNNSSREQRSDRDMRGRGVPPPGRDRTESRGRDFRSGDRNRAGTPRTVLCKFFQQGHCKVGDECDFLHPGINGPTRPSRFTTRFSSPPPSQRPGGKIESPIKITLDEEDNWDTPREGRDDQKFDLPPSSPMEVEEVAHSSSTEAPKVIPLNEPEVVVLD